MRWNSIKMQWEIFIFEVFLLCIYLGIFLYFVRQNGCFGLGKWNFVFYQPSFILSSLRKFLSSCSHDFSSLSLLVNLASCQMNNPRKEGEKIFLRVLMGVKVDRIQVKFLKLERSLGKLYHWLTEMCIVTVPLLQYLMYLQKTLEFRIRWMLLKFLWERNLLILRLLENLVWELWMVIS